MNDFSIKTILVFTGLILFGLVFLSGGFGIIADFSDYIDRTTY